MKTYKENQRVKSEYRGFGIIKEVRETCCLIRYDNGDELLTSFDIMDKEVTICEMKTKEVKTKKVTKEATLLHKKITLKYEDIELLKRGYSLNDIYLLRKSSGQKSTLSIHDLLAGKYKMHGISS